jgi:uncharacterized protein YdhG (YjbR/CyaY superfamily)
MANTTGPEDVDAYLENQPDDVRAALQQLRELIHSIAPDARELISYQVPTFAQDGMLVGYGAATNHCSLFTMSPPLAKRLKDELGDVKVSGATLHFTPGQPLPDDVVRLIVTERLKENAARKRKRDD